MFAVVKTGGKQYKVAVDDILKVEKLSGEAGSTVILDEVLMVGDDKDLKVGTPTLSGVTVSAEILEQTRGDKIIVFKKKRRQNYRRKKGHRQEITVLKVTGIGEGARKAAAPKKAAETKTESTPEAAKPAVKKTTETAKAAAPKKAAPKKAETADKKPAARKPAAKTSAARKPAAKKTEEK